MADLLWPGDERAAGQFDDTALLAAMVRVEDAWLDTIVTLGLAPAGARADLDGLVDEKDAAGIAAASEAGGSPVIGLVAALRDRVGPGDAATWIHRGLTSQDVLDTALMLCLRAAIDRIERELSDQAGAAVRLVREHRRTRMAARTLTQHAVPTTFGLKAAGWLDGLCGAAETLRRCRSALPAQTGGAAGTHAAVTELARLRGMDDPVDVAMRAAAGLAERLALAVVPSWHTNRSPVTGAGDALVGCADVWGRIAANVALLARPEIGELAELDVDGRGGSSTMPHKSNPILAVLIRRHAIAAPHLAATLHASAAAYVDERPDGAWHVEWATLRTLARRSVVAASQATELLAGLRVDAARMTTTAEAAANDLLAEQRTMASLAGSGGDAGDYLGATNALIDASLSRAAACWEGLA